MMSEIPDSVMTRLDNHEDRLGKTESELNNLKQTQTDITHRLIVIEEQGKARAKVTADSLERIEARMSSKFDNLTTQIAEQTGAQKQQNILAEQRLMRLKQLGVIIGIMGTILSVLFSYQEVASYLWTHILHLKEPWP